MKSSFLAEPEGFFKKAGTDSLTSELVVHEEPAKNRCFRTISLYAASPNDAMIFFSHKENAARALISLGQLMQVIGGIRRLIVRKFPRQY